MTKLSHQRSLPARVPLLDLKAINDRQREALTQAASRVMHSGWYIGGPEVEQFEHDFAQYCGVSGCVGVGNGLDALQLILQAYLHLGRLHPGDEVLVPSNTFIASVLAISACGLRPKLVDPDPATFNLTLAAIQSSVTSSTRAIMLVHLYGQLADVVAIQAFARQQGILLIEDAAQAHGAQLNEQRAGSWGDAAAFSFYPGKNLGALGDGGAVVSQDKTLVQLVRQLGNYGSQQKYHHDLLGSNSRLDPIQAALLVVKLPLLDTDNAYRQKVATTYCQQIQNPWVELPVLPVPIESHVFHIFALRTPFRHQLQQHLLNLGIETGIHYPIPIHQQLCYTDLSTLDLPVSLALSAQQLSIPISPVITPEQVERVIMAVNQFNPLEN